MKKLSIMGVALLLAAASTRPAAAQGIIRSGSVTPPVLQNREAIIKERDRLSIRLVGKHDTVTVRVFVLVDNRGNIFQPEVKDPVKDARLARAAIALVTNMRFKPAMQNGQPRAVLYTIPVRFARPQPKK